MRTGPTLALIICALVLAVRPAPASAAAPMTPEEIRQHLGFTDQEWAQVKQGQIVARAADELSDKELSIVIAVQVPAPLSRLVEMARTGKGLTLNREILAHNLFAPDVPLDKAFASASYDPSESAEIQKLFQAKGTEFNLSGPELAQFASYRDEHPGGRCGGDPKCTADVMGLYRSIMIARMKAYQEKGLDGVAPYARDGGGSADPAGELRKATDALAPLAARMPTVSSFLTYPKGDQTGMESRFAWYRQTIQDRPTFILAHRALWVGDQLVLSAERHFYVGQSYNSLQVIIGAFAQGDTSLLFYRNRTSTDQVAGFMQGTRHSMGRKFMEKEVRSFFETVLADLKK